MAVGPSYRRRALPLDLLQRRIGQDDVRDVREPVDDLNASEHTGGAAWEFGRIGDRHSCAKRNPLADALIRVFCKIQCHRRAASQLEMVRSPIERPWLWMKPSLKGARKVGIGRWYDALMRAVWTPLMMPNIGK